MTLDAKDFPKPLNQFIDEEIPVQKNTYDPITKKVISTYEMQKQKTMYINAPKEKMRCKSGEHVFRSINPHRGLFACTKCPFKRQVYPTTYKFNKDTGALIHIISGARI